MLLSKGRGLADGGAGLQSDSPELRHNVRVLLKETCFCSPNIVTFRSLQQHNVS